MSTEIICIRRLWIYNIHAIDRRVLQFMMDAPIHKMFVENQFHHKSFGFTRSFALVHTNFFSIGWTPIVLYIIVAAMENYNLSHIPIPWRCSTICCIKIAVDFYVTIFAITNSMASSCTTSLTTRSKTNEKILKRKKFQHLFTFHMCALHSWSWLGILKSQ